MKRKKLKKIWIIIAVVLVVVLAYPCFVTVQIVTHGYGIGSVFKIVTTGIKDQVLESSYSKTLEEALKNSDFDKENVDNYLTIEYHEKKNFIKRINNLISKGYSEADINLINETATELENLPVVQVVNYGEGIVEQMVSVFDLVNKIAFLVVIILVIVTVFLIVNTIKLTIFSRRREISIMRVVGASNWTIKNPFIIEGFVIGLLGSIVPIILTVYGYTSFYNSLDDGHLFSSLIELLPPQPFVFFVSLAIVVIGVVVGMFGSGRAVRKYLKV